MGGVDSGRMAARLGRRKERLRSVICDIAKRPQHAARKVGVGLFLAARRTDPQREGKRRGDLCM